MRMTKSVIEAGEKAAPQSYGENIQRADLIVVGEYLADGKIVVSTVLKGDKANKGKTLSLSQPMRMGCRSQAIPGIKEVVILLRSDKRPGWAGLEIYDTPDQKSMIRCLVPIYLETSEHTRIERLAELFSGKSKRCSETFEIEPSTSFKREFIWSINRMRESANFVIVQNLYEQPQLTYSDKLMLQDWIANTLDTRALPILTSALHDKNHFVASDAAQKLILYFPGPVTDKALKEAASKLPADVLSLLASYFKRRGVPSHDLVEHLKVKSTPFQQAEELEAHGKLKEAAAGYLSILQSNENNAYIVRTAILKALKYGDHETREKALKAKLAWLTQDADGCNYLEAVEDARALREARDPKCLEALLKIMDRREQIFSKANKIATMAVRELGTTQKSDAAASLRAHLKYASPLGWSPEHQVAFLLEYAWVSNEDDYNKAAQLLANRTEWSNSWKTLQPLLSGLHENDEGSFLIERLKNSEKLPPTAIDWIIFRLGDLRENRAVEVLVKLLQHPAYDAQTVPTALESIGSAHVVEQIEPIASDGKSPYQASAVGILANIEHEKSLPFLRRLLVSSGLDVKVQILAALSRFGTCDDLSIIRPESYWTSDRDTTYWRLQAASEIEMRCSCSNKAITHGK